MHGSRFHYFSVANNAVPVKSGVRGATGALSRLGHHKVVDNRVDIHAYMDMLSHKAWRILVC